MTGRVIQAQLGAVELAEWPIPPWYRYQLAIATLPTCVRQYMQVSAIYIRSSCAGRQVRRGGSREEARQRGGQEIEKERQHTSERERVRERGGGGREGKVSQMVTG